MNCCTLFLSDRRKAKFVLTGQYLYIKKKREAKVKVCRSDLSVTLKSNKGILRKGTWMCQALTAGKALQDGFEV